LGQAPSISADAAGLVGYHSPNEPRPADGQVQEDESPEDEELRRLRGTAQSNEEIHRLLSWTMRKDYPTLIGISLPIKNWVLGESHEIQFWEEATDPLQFTNPTSETYDWLVQRLSGRSGARGGNLPIGMPRNSEGLSVRTHRDGHQAISSLSYWIIWQIV
jgi:hypothetical protein